MAEALTATARMDLRWVLGGLTHKLSTYCAYNDVLGQHQLVDRDGITTILWTVAGQYMWDKLRAMLSATGVVAVPSLTLMHRTGTLWTEVSVANLTGTGSHISATQTAQQMTWTLRDTSFKKIRFMVFESVYGYLYHSQNGTGSDGTQQAVSDMLSGADTNANAPYRWMKSRGDRFLLSTGAIAGLTHDLNDFLKRRRGWE